MKKNKKLTTRGKMPSYGSQDSKRFNNIQNMISSNTEAEASPYLGGGLGYFGTDARQIDRAGSPGGTYVPEVSEEGEGIITIRPFETVYEEPFLTSANELIFVRE